MDGARSPRPGARGGGPALGADGVSTLRPLPLSVLVRRAAEELPTGSLYDLPMRHVFRGFPGLDLSVRFHGHRCATPIGPAAGPTRSSRRTSRCRTSGGRKDPRAQDGSGERPARDPAPVHRHADRGLQHRVVAGAPRRRLPPRVREGAAPRGDPGRAVRHSRARSVTSSSTSPSATTSRASGRARSPRSSKACATRARSSTRSARRCAGSFRPLLAISPTFPARHAPLGLGHALDVPRLSGRRDRRHRPAPPRGARPPHDREAEPDPPRIRGGGGRSPPAARVHEHRPASRGLRSRPEVGQRRLDRRRPGGRGRAARARLRREAHEHARRRQRRRLHARRRGVPFRRAAPRPGADARVEAPRGAGRGVPDLLLGRGRRGERGRRRSRAASCQ